MKWHRVWSVIACLAISTATAAQGLTLGVAASMSDAMREVGRAFERSHPGFTVRLNVAASGALLQQVIHGAPLDVIISADDETMQRASTAAVIDPKSLLTFASNTVVLVTPRPPSIPILRLDDLRDPRVRRVAIGKEQSVPAGRYARAALTSAGLWEAVRPKLIPADHVRQVVEYVVRGEVDAGIVYATDVRGVQPGKITIVQTLTGHPPVTYQAALVVGSQVTSGATSFLRFLSSQEALRILAQHGFLPPPR